MTNDDEENRWKIEWAQQRTHSRHRYNSRRPQHPCWDDLPTTGAASWWWCGLWTLRENLNLMTFTRSLLTSVYASFEISIWWVVFFLRYESRERDLPRETQHYWRLHGAQQERKKKKSFECCKRAPWRWKIALNTLRLAAQRERMEQQNVEVHLRNWSEL